MLDFDSSGFDWQILVFTCLMGGLFGLFSVSPAEAQTVVQEVEDVSRFGFVGDGYRDCGLRRRGVADVSIRPDRAKQQNATANITVDYSSDFTDEARAAFERAVQIWENHIASPVEIRIDADRLQDPQAGVLGAAGPSSFWVIESDQDFIAGAALADALVGSDTEPDSSDITARFNLDRDDWHYGESDAPPSQLDFTTVVLHEIGHGLNFLSLCSTSGGQAQCKFDVNGDLLTDSYTQALAEEENGELTFLTNESVYPNPSSELLDALTSDQLFYSASNAELAAGRGEGPNPPKMYAPSGYQRGSSISHNDEETYPTGTVNSLMTPNLGAGETVRLPGPLVCAQLIDAGWPVGSSNCSLNEVVIENLRVPTESASVSSDNEGSVTLNWQQLGNGEVQEFVVEQKYFDEGFRKRVRIPADGPGSYRVNVDGLKVGTHRFRISYVDGNGDFVRGGTISNPVTIEAQKPEVLVSPNPFRNEARISFVLEEAQRVQVDVFDALGRRVSRLFDGQRPADDARPVVFEASSLPSGNGVYFVRVDGEDFTKTVKVVRVR